MFDKYCAFKKETVESLVSLRSIYSSNEKKDIDEKKATHAIVTEIVQELREQLESNQKILLRDQSNYLVTQV